MENEELDFRRDVDPNTMYELTALLGEGSYGAVYRSRPRTASIHQEVAIKIIPDADDDLTALWREIRFLQVLRSPFVVSFIESFLFDNELWLAMELCDGGSLYDLKEAHKDSFLEPELQTIMAFCVMGLAHLHAQMSIHRDVKSGNVLLTKDGRAKLGDFGISAQLTDTIMKRRTVIGSPYWMAPEVIQETSYDGKADIWSLGITLLELCDGSPPHFSIHPMRAIFIISSKPAPTVKDRSRWSEDLQDFLGQCLVKDCDKRASAADLLSHRWIQKAVREIGPTGRGSPVLADLVNNNWEAIERVRVARFKLPENIPVGDSNQRSDSAGSVEAERNSEGNMATMRTIRSNNSSGIPATRQQIRNATLTRSITPSNRFRPSSRGSGDGENADYNSTLVRRPLPPVQQDGTFVRIQPDHKHSTPDRMQYKNAYSRPDAARRSPDMDRDGTLVMNSGRKPLPVDEYDNDPNGTFVPRRRGSDAKDEVANNAAGGKNNMQAALRYFRDEAVPGPSEPKDSHSKPSRQVAKTESNDIATGQDAKEVVMRSQPSQQREDSELEILNGLTLNGIQQDDPTKDLLKKDILRQISTLKKQYREDLEKLTQSYEARRKLLKDALLSLSSNAAESSEKISLSAYKNDRKKS